MKKFISAVLAGSLAVSAMGTVFASAAEKYGDGKKIVVFGDSIAEGYDLDESEYNYGQIIADYLGGTVSNYAKAGAETGDTLEQISKASDLKDADVVIISSGANDMIHYASNSLLKVFANIGALSGEYTKDDIPEKPTFTDMMNMIDTAALKEYASKTQNQMKLNSYVLNISNNLTVVTGDPNYENYKRIIETEIVVNIEKMISDVKAVNPDAEIILQTIYNPLQLEDEFLSSKVPSNYRSMLELLKPTFDSIIASYRKQVMDIEGVKIADVYDDFTCDSASGYSWYFTGFQDSSVKDFKVHPNQAGHLAIAADILGIIGEKKEDGGLLNSTYEKLGKKADYPAAALAKYEKVAGSYINADATGDLMIDAKDATLALIIFAANSTSTEISEDVSDAGMKAADADGNGIIDSKDASLMLSYYSFLSTGGAGKSLKYYLANEF